MRALAIACLLVLVLTGATCRVKDSAPVGDADARCYRPVIPSVDPVDTGVRWECDAEDPACWDELKGDVIDPLQQKVVEGELARQACAGFLEDLKRRGVYRGAPE